MKPATSSRCTLLLFPGCDPRGVLTRALAKDAPPWATRPDALVFGWMLALSSRAQHRAAAAAVRAVAGADTMRNWTVPQEQLLAMLKGVENGER